MGHDVCETMGACVTAYADFLDGVIYSLSVSSHRSMMPATKPVEVYALYVRVLSDVVWRIECLILCCDRVFVWL